MGTPPTADVDPPAVASGRPGVALGLLQQPHRNAPAQSGRAGPGMTEGGERRHVDVSIAMADGPVDVDDEEGADAVASVLAVGRFAAVHRLDEGIEFADGESR